MSLPAVRLPRLARRLRPAEPPRKLSEELDALQLRIANRAATLREVIVVLGRRAYILLLILLALPFGLPLPLPGLSTPFGLAIAAISLRLALGQRPWLPKAMQRRTIPAGFLNRTIIFCRSTVRVMEKLLKPRLVALTDTGHLAQVHAFFMLLSALVLLLPLPIPFSNAFPAWAILLIAAGLLERDGLAILAGYLCFAAGVVFFVLVGASANHIFQQLWAWLTG